MSFVSYTTFNLHRKGVGKKVCFEIEFHGVGKKRIRLEEYWKSRFGVTVGTDDAGFLYHRSTRHDPGLPGYRGSAALPRSNSWAIGNLQT